MASKPSDVLDELLQGKFSLLDTGTCRRTEVIPKSEKDPINPTVPLNTLPLGLPPVLPTVETELEKLLLHPEELPIHDLDRVQRYLPRVPDPTSLYHTDVTPVQTSITVDRNPTTGKLLGFKEEHMSNTGTSKNSMSLKRIPGALSDGIRGSTTSYPFWPGGLEEPELPTLNTEDMENIDFDHNLLTVPPGFSSGMTFEDQVKSADIAPAVQPTAVIDVADILTAADEFEFSLEEEDVEEEKTAHPITDIPRSESLENLVEESSATADEAPKPSAPEPKKEEWAFMVDITTPVEDFHKRIPEMACTWPFEPDVFQKQAILHLENRESVFVAAHTSAGKTVVAEYAIALSMRHMTKTVYTSPIKALSNQKFREFKGRFGDEVGLVTGDVQINREASCLIMTTEILRSMLYNGAEIIRELEWVIFDEVHYINDSERGVVWEEVLIMLPEHVNIILLSATVPNTLEFADWIGRMKRKKIYVISTLKRPVPLEHYLFTGNSTKTSTQLFLLIDAKGNFLTKGYQQAIDAKKERASKSSQSYGAKGPRGGNPHQDKNVWLAVIDMLKKKDKLPVVAFTFSKKKIEENSQNLNSVDLTSSTEKSEIHVFFQKCVSRLKGSDKELPQVIQMQGLLKRGIGIHHSGILPILKEMVEMLFQRGLVKILFATETFAMGVNMPARTVVFDSIRKHDGTNFRDLLPGEYIQMAGRAGRRGLDTTGTVIVLCKGDVPEMSDLHKMMLGKPTVLSSQFRLTYSMILNLLRVEELRVEDMMKRSFSEFHSQKDRASHKETLTELQGKLSELKDLECSGYCYDMEGYCKQCSDYWKLKFYLQKSVMSHPAAVKSLSPGRVVLVNNAKHKNTLGAILQSNIGKSKERIFTVLIICELSSDSKESDTSIEDYVSDRLILKPVLAKQKLFQPEGPCGHKVLTVTAEDISAITTQTIKLEAEKIIDNIKKREIPRFKNDPPSQAVSMATQELLRLAETSSDGIPQLDPVTDFKLRDINMIEDFRRLKFLEASFNKFSCIYCPNFENHFNEMKSRLILQDEFQHIKYLLSDESLHLLPEYQQRIQVIRSYNFIDDTNTVQLKGRVACEISNQELLITELVFENVLTDLDPREIAGLLSCVVFEQKRCSEPTLVDTLSKAKDRIIEIATRIGQVQRQCGLDQPVEDYVEELKFGLVEVVFEWARGMSFSEITKLTDVQEGIIVRCIIRLDEVLRDVRNAARIIGDPVLHSKMVEASDLIKRDIVFAASLYTQ